MGHTLPMWVMQVIKIIGSCGSHGLLGKCSSYKSCKSNRSCRSLPSGGSLWDPWLLSAAALSAPYFESPFWCRAKQQGRCNNMVSCVLAGIYAWSELLWKYLIVFFYLNCVESLCGSAPVKLCVCDAASPWSQRPSPDSQWGHTDHMGNAGKNSFHAGNAGQTSHQNMQVTLVMLFLQVFKYLSFWVSESLDIWVSESLNLWILSCLVLSSQV